MAEIRDAVGNALYQANQDHNPNNKPHVKSGLWSIQQWENLQKDRTSYCDVRRTLQYYGQFGDSAFSLTTNSKFEKNKLIQLQTLGAARNLDRRVLRMMYWTTTGLKQSIEDRNDTMWRRDRMREFLEVWQSGMGGNILQHSPFLVHQNPKSMMGSVAQQIREYFPNIIMIDFADPGKCRYIFNLNLMTTGQLQSEESWLRNLLFSYY
jgi:hypothetical protein